MVASLLLALLNSYKPFIVETEVSDLVVGAVPLQVGSNNLEHPVSCCSSKMLPPNQFTHTLQGNVF